jgi:hypothetical protein
MSRPTFAITVAAVLLLASGAAGQAKRYSLEAVDGLTMHYVVATPATLHGKKGLRIAESDEARSTPSLNPMAVLQDVDFTNGVIELELAGAPASSGAASAGARGFVGIAFRVRGENSYDAFYLRPTNGRADDQERRNHATQYISHPDWPWQRLRKETPGRYESYVDLVPDEWTRIRVDVQGDQAALYVLPAPQPVLIVNDVKSGANARGAVGLWIGPETIAHFRDLTITRRP